MSDPKALPSMSQVWAHLESGGCIWWSVAAGARRVAWLDGYALMTDEPSTILGLTNTCTYYICDDFDEQRYLASTKSVAELAEMLAERSSLHAEARDALGAVWLRGGLSLAEGIRAKTTFLEHEQERLKAVIARLEENLTEARLSMEMCCEEPCGSCAGCTRASEVHEGGAS